MMFRAQVNREEARIEARRMSLQTGLVRVAMESMERHLDSVSAHPSSADPVTKSHWRLFKYKAWYMKRQVHHMRQYYVWEERPWKWVMPFDNCVQDITKRLRLKVWLYVTVMKIGLKYGFIQNESNMYCWVDLVSDLYKTMIVEDD
jgi:hypothetical protein